MILTPLDLLVNWIGFYRNRVVRLWPVHSKRRPNIASIS